MRTMVTIITRMATMTMMTIITMMMTIVIDDDVEVGF